MGKKSKDPLDEVKEIHKAIWRSQPPPKTKKEAQVLFVSAELRKIGVALVTQGVTSAILEGSFMVWWLRVACANRPAFGKNGFERCLASIGPIMKQVYEILEDLIGNLQDEGAMPEMELLGKKLEEAKEFYGVSGGTWPASKEDADTQTKLANDSIQPKLIELIDAGIPLNIIESLLFYYWLRATAINRNLKEEYFQKLERNWDTVMDKINPCMDKVALQLSGIYDR